jgi:ubiquinone/menaquinone biosynthesis C-methylase UbiE
LTISLQRVEERGSAISNSPGKFLQDYFHDNADKYIAEMEEADNVGPGTLELNPDMELPKYTKHEIHIMPGGYVGDEFAGHIYHYGTNSFYVSVLGDNEQDQIHIGVANRLPLPEDGKVKRILIMGCGPGQMTVALKERFPDAEVWGIDVGGPLVRYGHMRARDLGVDINFAQRLAEDTKFEDGYFDIVTSYIINHELPQEANKAVIAEAYRVTRPGGYYYPIDFKTGGVKGRAHGQFSRWGDHRWNSEVWSREYHALDFDGEIEKAGFKINHETKAALPGFGARHAVKIA